MAMPSPVAAPPGLVSDKTNTNESMSATDSITDVPKLSRADIKTPPCLILRLCVLTGDKTELCPFTCRVTGSMSEILR